MPDRSGSGQTRTFHQALCEHSVPVRHIERTAPRVFCPACLVLYGTHIPDDQRRQSDGQRNGRPTNPGKNRYGWRPTP